MIKFPETWGTENWYNGIRHKFEIDGFSAWIVEPKQPAADGRWSWVTCWPEAFVPRVGVVDLLEQGYYHAHIDVFETRATPDHGIPVMKKFYQICVDLGLAPQVNLIGLSWGGLFALRFAQENPEKVACLYLDAPVCNMGDGSEPYAAERRRELSAAWHLSAEELLKSPLNPINNTAPLVQAGIPIFAATGEHDLVVPVENNINLLEKALLAQGGKIKIVRRPSWGHHPHGFDDTTALLEFMNRYAAGGKR